jgi:4'-phosphopantetheinyl transferase
MSKPTDMARSPSERFATLSATERRRLAGIRDSQAAADYLAGRSLARSVLASYAGCDPGALTFDRTCRHCGGSHGKPTVSLAGRTVDFSLSHAAGVAVLAVTSGDDVGIDIEPLRLSERDGVVAEALRGTLSEAEATGVGLESGYNLLRHWTRKEALLKASGHGLVVEPSKVTLCASGSGRWVVAEAAHLRDPPRWRIADLDLAGEHVGAVAVRGRLDHVAMCCWKN